MTETDQNGFSTDVVYVHLCVHGKGPFRNHGGGAFQVMCKPNLGASLLAFGQIYVSSLPFGV